MKKQYIGGVYKISSWADITNAHGVTGNGVVEGLKQGAKNHHNQEPRGLLMLAELSSVGSLAYGEYSQKLLKLLNPIRNLLLDCAQRDMGGQEEGFDWLIMTPGVGLDDKGDGLGQQYRTVDEVVSWN